VEQLQQAEARAHQPVDPTLPIELERVRRQTERAFAGFRNDDIWTSVASSSGADLTLVTAGLSLVSRWLSGKG
jgi:hypothetical protein